MGRGWALSLLVALLEELSQGSVGSLVVLMETPRGLIPRGTFQNCCWQHSCPQGKPLLTHASTGYPPTLVNIFGCLLLLCPGSWCTQILFVPSKSGVCFSKSYWSPVIKFHQPSKSDSLWVPTHFAGSPPWEGLSGAQNFLYFGRTSSVLWSSVCGSPTQRV